MIDSMIDDMINSIISSIYKIALVDYKSAKYLYERRGRVISLLAI